MDGIKDNLDINMNYTKAENNNQVIKERLCMAFHQLPYKAIPEVMT
jgi:hypothetical protein